MTASNAHPQAFRTVDILKIIAAQCIVLHHFSAYGPLSAAAAESVPSMSHWLFDDARIAVQVFLVIAGYLAARGVALNSRSQGLLQAVGRRYLRLVVPFGAALVLTMACAELARPALHGDPILPGAPKLSQLLAHISLLHSVLDVESLSVGVWYVAIDFQLYVTMALLIWMGQGQRALNLTLVALLTMASLVWFNLDASLNVWAPYYFGAYGLGALAWWAGLRARLSLLALGLYVATLSAGLASLAIEFRARIALAISVSVALSTLGRYPLRLPRAADRWIGRLSRTSYALFLVHFSVLLLANAVWAALDPDNADWVWVFLAASWALSLVVSYAFHTQVELRFEAWRQNARTNALLASK
jgi:peptidoglycan/LPS O-acetylase OafA/YrhL